METLLSIDEVLLVLIRCTYGMLPCAIARGFVLYVEADELLLARTSMNDRIVQDRRKHKTELLPLPAQKRVSRVKRYVAFHSRTMQVSKALNFR